MNYKDLLYRYKNGLVNEEEKQLVEQELEKQEALEDYLSEKIDDELVTRSNMSIIEMHDEETNKLKKSVNSKFRSIIVKTVLIIIALYIGVFHILSGIVDLLYYNPSATSQSEEQEYKSPDFYYDMQAYVTLNMPGHTINSFTSQESKGFGKYETSYSLGNLFTDTEQRHFVDISRNRLTWAIDGIFTREKRFELWEGFEKIKYGLTDESQESIEARDRFILKQNEDTIYYLNELNPLSYVSMSIIFNEDLNMDELYNVINESDDIKFKWVGIRTMDADTVWMENQPIHLVGFNPNSSDEPSSERRPNLDSYPFFYLEDWWRDPSFRGKNPAETMPGVYETHFKSRLSYLSNREDFIEMFDYNSYKIEFYDYALEYVEENGLKSYGAVVFGRADKLLEYIEGISYDSIYINQVLPTKANIYYQ